MHSPGGDRIDIHHNTFELVENRGGNTTAAVAVRGTPASGARVADNWFYNPTDPGGDRLADGSPVVQYDNDAGSSGWDEVTLSGNHSGSEEPPIDVGHPRETDDAGDTVDRRDVITIGGRGSTANYAFSVSGEIEKSTGYGGTINAYDSIDGSRVTGNVEKSTAYDASVNVYDSTDGSRVTGRTTREPDSFVFTGEITEFETSARVETTIDGDRTDLDP